MHDGIEKKKAEKTYNPLKTNEIPAAQIRPPLSPLYITKRLPYQASKAHIENEIPVLPTANPFAIPCFIPNFDVLSNIFSYFSTILLSAVNEYTVFMELRACSKIVFAFSYSFLDSLDSNTRYFPYIIPGIIRRISVGKATSDSLHEKNAAKPSPDMNTVQCIKKMGT